MFARIPFYFVYCDDYIILFDLILYFCYSIGELPSFPPIYIYFYRFFAYRPCVAPRIILSRIRSILSLELHNFRIFHVRSAKLINRFYNSKSTCFSENTSKNHNTPTHLRCERSAFLFNKFLCERILENR